MDTCSSIEMTTNRRMRSDVKAIFVYICVRKRQPEKTAVAFAALFSKEII
jgi:hypothetical protein